VGSNPIGSTNAPRLARPCATTPYVLFLDADDFLEGQFLAGGVRAMRKAAAAVGFGNVEVETPNGRVKPGLPTFKTAAAAVRFLLCEHFINPSAVVLAVPDVRKVGAWREELSCRQDLDLWMRLLSTNPPVTTWTEGAAVFFQHATPTRISRDVSEQAMRDTARVIYETVHRLRQLGFSEAEIKACLKPTCYWFLRRAARYAPLASYRTIYSAWRALGGRRHIGSLPHQLAASLLGLRLKEKLVTDLTLRTWRRQARP